MRAVKVTKFLVGMAMIPLCLGAAAALLEILRLSTSSDGFWAAFAAGAACWWVIFALLPKPLWIYVLGHELTHALWTWAFGGRVKRLRVSARGGHVVITKTNFLISLAPYFFPLYAIIVIVVFKLLEFTSSSSFGAARDFLVGIAYAFHLTLTVHALRTEQTDITEHGYLFSIVIIVLANLLLAVTGVCLLTVNGRLYTALLLVLTKTNTVFEWLGELSRIRGRV